MSKNEFLALATHSDSLTATVNMFFRKRKASTTTGLVVAGGATLIGLVVTVAHTTAEQLVGTIHSITGVPMEKTNNPGGPIILVGLTGGVIINAIGRANYNKNDLHRVITDYQETKQIPYEYAGKLTPRDFPSLPRRLN